MVTVILVLIEIGFYVAVPAGLVWGWIRLLRNRQSKLTCLAPSLAAFALGTASAVLAIGATLFSSETAGISGPDPSMLRLYRTGALLSLLGIVLGVVGVCRPGPLRWHAPACAMGTMIFWLVAASGE
jgi:hypothetical protein